MTKLLKLAALMEEMKTLIDEINQDDSKFGIISVKVDSMRGLYDDTGVQLRCGIESLDAPVTLTNGTEFFPYHYEAKIGNMKFSECTKEALACAKLAV